jgi:hypothetical protein
VQYSGSLLEEQKELLSKYIASFSDNGVDLKVFMNEEIGRLKSVVSFAKNSEHIRTDEDMQKKTERVHEVLENFKNEEMNEDMIKRTLKIQDLAREISE